MEDKLISLVSLCLWKQGIQDSCKSRYCSN